MKTIKRKPRVIVRSFLHRNVKGVFSPIPYQEIVPTGDWTPYLGTTYQTKQKYGQYDTDDCWCFSSSKTCIEMQLNALWTSFLSDAKDFFISEGLADSLGRFNISERFYAIKGGNRNNGGTAEELFQLIQDYGLVPQGLLEYTDAQANACPTYQTFLDDYFNPSAITKQMLDIGAQSKQYFTLQYQRIGSMWNTPNKTLLSGAMKQAPLAYSIPVNVPSWNQVNVPAYTGPRLDHEVGGYVMTQTTAGFPICDNYAPFLKVLADGYGIWSCAQAVITPIVSAAPVSQPSVWEQVWASVMVWFRSVGLVSP